MSAQRRAQPCLEGAGVQWEHQPALKSIPVSASLSVLSLNPRRQD